MLSNACIYKVWSREESQMVICGKPQAIPGKDHCLCQEHLEVVQDNETPAIFTRGTKKPIGLVTTRSSKGHIRTLALYKLVEFKGYLFGLTASADPKNYPGFRLTHLDTGCGVAPHEKTLAKAEEAGLRVLNETLDRLADAIDKAHRNEAEKEDATGISRPFTYTLYAPPENRSLAGLFA